MKSIVQDPIHRLALRNCLRNWRYSLSSILAVGIGLLSLWTFRGYMLCVAEMYQDHFQARNMLGDLLIEADRAENQDIWVGALSKSEQSQIDSILAPQKTKILSTLRFLNIEGQVSLGVESSIFVGLAYDRDPGQVMRKEKWGWNAVAGHPLRANQEVIIGRELSRLLGCEVLTGDYLHRVGSGPAYLPFERPFTCGGTALGISTMLNISTEQGQINASYFNVAGIMDAGFRDLDRTWLMLDLKDAQTLFDTDRVSWYSIQLQDPSQSQGLIQNLNHQFDQAGLPIHARSWNKHRFSELYGRTMSLLGIFENFVTLILSGIICITIFNLMVKVIQERTKEIGLLRTLGYRPLQLQRMFLEESFLSVSIGIGLGTLGAMAVTWIANSLGIPYKAGILSEPVPFAITLSFKIWTSSFVTLMTLSLLATALASYQALRKTVIECLTHA